MTEQLTKLSNQIKENFLTVQYGWVFVEITNYFISEDSNINIETISVEEFDDLRTKEKITIIDVRERGELPLVDEFSFTSIPLGEFENSVLDIATENKIVVFCKSGIRSAKALKILKNKLPTCIAFSLEGGIEERKIIKNKN